jgi:hypothetical protein
MSEDPDRTKRAPSPGISACQERVVVKVQDSLDGVADAEIVSLLSTQLASYFPPSQTFSVASLLNDDNRVKFKAKVAELQHFDPHYTPRKMLNYFTVEYPPSVSLSDLLTFLVHLPSVKLAYEDVPAENAEVQPDDDCRFPEQGYLGAAPDGIGVSLVWPRAGGVGVPGADGAGISFIDMELGWTLDHEDLGTHGKIPLHGEIQDGSREHGTAVLGVICALDNSIGCIGITPNLTSVDVVSYNNCWQRDCVNAMVPAFDRLNAGDVLLLEAQLADPINPKPLEFLPHVFEMIATLTDRGIIVIEPAGNNARSGQDIALFATNLDPDAPDFEDSGAIVVAAASSTYPHERRANSNFGKRVDCYAWGDSVATLFSDVSGITTSYRPDFRDTSAASAIIAGAAASLQGMAQQNLGYRLGPRELRAILADRATGTLSAGDEAADGAMVDLIGVMPDLDTISREVLNVVPAPYIRDSVTDDGSGQEAVFASPDILLVNATDRPQSLFGEGSGTENSYVWSTNKDDTGTALFVRARNRGGAPAAPIRASVFWSPMSTLLVPEDWRAVGSGMLPSIPVGDVLTVSEPIGVADRGLPNDGQYGVIALLGEADRPGLHTWDEYLKFVRQARIGVRNLGLVDYLPSERDDQPDARDYVEVSFLAPGPPDIGRLMQLETDARLPRGARVWIEAPPLLTTRRSARRVTRSTTWLPVKPNGRTRTGESLFNPRSKARIRVLVHIPPEQLSAGYSVSVAQLYKGVSVGRVAWIFRPAPPSVGT